MQNKPFYSVVIPLYNRAHLIAETVQSVLDQSFQDFEIIIVDDGSSDNPRPVIEAIGDCRIKLIEQENKGGSAARNTGIEAATGKYIAFLDSDDLWLPHHLEQALPVLESGDSICTYTQVIVDRGDGVTFLKPPRGVKENEDFSEYMLCDRGFVQTSSLIVPAFLAKKILFDNYLDYGQDTDFAIRLVAEGADLQMLSEPGAIWKDFSNASRTSAQINPEIRRQWLERMEGIISPKAKKCALARGYAKGLRQQGKWFSGLCLYLNALVSGCYRPKMAIIIFLQVILSDRHYRTLADFLARKGVKP